jgi:hypothetical protein
VAKLVGSPYRSGDRCGDWLKWRANRGQEFVIGGYLPGGTGVESILVGYYIDRKLMYMLASARASQPTCAASSSRSWRSCRHRDARSSICPIEPKAAGAKGSLEWHECSCAAVAIELLRRAGS